MTAVLNWSHPQLRVIIRENKRFPCHEIVSPNEEVHWVLRDKLCLTLFSSVISSAPMNRKSAMTRQKRTPNCWCCFKARVTALLDHSCSAFTTRKTPTKWSARKLQKKATTKWCWTMWCGRWPLYCWLLLSLPWLLASSPRDVRTVMKDWTAQQHHYSRLAEYGVQWNKTDLVLTSYDSRKTLSAMKVAF